MARLLIVFLLPLCLQCTSYNRALKTTAAYLNEREAQGCVWGEAAVGGGFGGALTGRVRFAAAIGGVDPALCTRGE